RGAAHLPRTEEAAEDGALCSPLEGGVLADGARPFAARIDQGSLETGGADDLLRGRMRPDETDAVDAGMRDEAFAHVAAAVDDVHYAVRQAGVRHDLHEV